MHTFGYRVKVIVVDNGSTDKTGDAIAKEHPEVTVVSSNENLGFSGGNNVGIQKAFDLGSEYIWLLNNDTLVDKNALQLVDAFEDSKIGAAGSKIYFAPGHEYHKERYKDDERGKVIWYAGGQIDWQNMIASHYGVDEVDRGQFNSILETQFITGCSFMTKKEIIERVGLLDEKFYLYLEDLDWCMRIQKAGYKTLYFPKSVVWHVNAGSTGKPGNPTQDYYLTRNRLLIGLRYASLRTKFALIKEATKELFGKNSNRKRAILDAFLGRLGKQYEKQ